MEGWSRGTESLFVPMSENLNTNFDKTQLKILLDGLSYVRSNILLEFREPSEEDSARREKELQEVESLMLRLKGKQPAGVPAGV